jgi:aspartate carbamoyltransferase catalytic subunit
MVANLFFEPSTRTRFSFEVAAKRLGAEVLNFSESSSSRTKGETIYDTLKTLEAMGVQAAVIRSTENHLLNELQDQLNLSLVNAGAGYREHPTQALLDLLTMKEQFGQIDGLTVGIIGDIAHSRVAGSHMYALPKLGAELLIAGPPNMVERKEDPIPNGVIRSTIDEIVDKADVVMMLRIQHERHYETTHLSVEEYHQSYGLTLERANRMKSGAVIMHPGPFNRGVEIDTELIEAPNSLIHRQVTNGVFIRMAVLETLLGGERHE